MLPEIYLMGKRKMQSIYVIQRKDDGRYFVGWERKNKGCNRHEWIPIFQSGYGKFFGAIPTNAAIELEIITDVEIIEYCNSKLS